LCVSCLYEWSIVASYGGGLAGIDRWSSEWYNRMISASHRTFDMLLRAVMFLRTAALVIYRNDVIIYLLIIK
jgi:hypothetical protein